MPAKPEFAPGIPMSRAIESLPLVGEPEKWDLAIQRHVAEKAKEHYDLRLVDPKTQQAHSWALRHLPKPGEMRLAVQQPTHTADYALNFQGRIESGYGKGDVEMARRDKAEVLRASDKEVRFNLYPGREVEEYALRHTGGNRWLLQNVTTTRQSGPGQKLPSSKPSYKVVQPDRLKPDDPNTVLQAKIDGAHVLYQFKQPGQTPRAISYRPTERATGLIEHTQKLPGFQELRTPSGLRDTILRGELYAVDQDGKALPAARVGGILNAGVWKSREKQEQEGKLVPVAFDVVRYKGKDVENEPFSTKQKILETVYKLAPWLQKPRTAETPEEKLQLIEDIRKGKESSTEEGVVEWRQDRAVPAKSKFLRERDVYIRDVFPEAGTKRQEPLAGGFEFSTSPKGPIVGRVGSGFSHALKRDMLENPDKYRGLKARVLVQPAPAHYAPRAPVFHSFHLDQDLPENVKTAKVRSVLRPHQQRVVDKIQQSDQPGLVVAHGLGSGKTLTSIAAHDALGVAGHVLVPAALQDNYRKELKKHVVGSSPEAAISTLQRIARSEEPLKTPLLIVDEAHRAREVDSKTHAALKDALTDKRLLLTASPFYNRPSDIAGLVNIAAGKNLMPAAQTEFKKRYIKERRVGVGLGGWLRGAKPGVVQEMDPSKEQELRGIFQKWVDYQPASEEGYPSVSRSTVTVPMTREQLKVYDTMIGQAPPWVAFKIKAGLPPSKMESRQLNAFASAVRQISNSTRAHAPGMAPQEPKVEVAFNNLKRELDRDPESRGIVYSNYLDTGIAPYQERLEAAGIPYGLYTGEMKRKERDQLVRDYNTGKKRVILLSSAGGEGLDLKGTRLVQILEPHWNKEKLKQVEGRAIRFKSHEHLPEQDRHVKVESYLATRPEVGFLQKYNITKPGGGIDEYLTRMSTDKEKLIEQFKSLMEQEKLAQYDPKRAARVKKHLDAFMRKNKLTGTPVVLSGTSLYLQGIRPKLKDIDVMIPGMKEPLMGHMYRGVEFDAGGTLMGPRRKMRPLERSTVRNAVDIGGVKAQSIPDIIAFKKMMGRPKDVKDVEMLKAHLKKTAAATATVRRIDGGLRIVKLHVPPEERGQGKARKLLGHIKDKYKGAELHIRPRPYGDMPMDIGQLRDFYESEGFRTVDGRDNMVLKTADAISRAIARGDITRNEVVERALSGKYTPDEARQMAAGHGHIGAIRKHLQPYVFRPSKAMREVKRATEEKVIGLPKVTPPSPVLPSVSKKTVSRLPRGRIATAVGLTGLATLGGYGLYRSKRKDQHKTASSRIGRLSPILKSLQQKPKVLRPKFVEDVPTDDDWGFY